MGWKWGALNAFGIISYALTSLVILVYITVSISAFVYYRRKHRAEFNAWLHGVFPTAGALLFLPPLYYQYRPLPPYPLRYGNWAAIGLLRALRRRHGLHGNSEREACSRIQTDLHADRGR